MAGVTETLRYRWSFFPCCPSLSRLFSACQFCFPTGQPTCVAESAGATVAGSFLGGVVAGGVAALLVVGIMCGSWKLKHSGGKRWEVDSKGE